MKSIDTIALGTCYVDTNLPDYPFSETGIPVETELVGGQYEMVAGGSAVNFCRLLGTFGLNTAFIGVAGNDPNGDILESLLQQDGIDSQIVRQPGLQTNTSFNMTNSNGEHIMLVAGTANATLNPEMVLPRLSDMMSDAKTFYLGGCFKLQSLAPAFVEMAEIASQHDVATVVDHGRIPAGTNPEMLVAVKQLVLHSTYYLPSRDEFCQLWQVDNIEEGIKALHDRAADLNVIVKDGANGAYYWENGSVQHIPAPYVDKVVHVTGAGDSFNAGAMAAITRQYSIHDAVSYGCTVAAARIAGKPVPQL